MKKQTYSVSLNPYVVALNPRFITKGNIKLGNKRIWTWSTLPGNGVFDTDYGTITGTCGDHCTGCYNVENPKLSPCYVFKALNRYPSVKKCYAKNTLCMRLDVVTVTSLLLKQLRNARKKPDIIRLNQSGEMETENDLLMYITVANFFPEIKLYLYTKNYGLIRKYIRDIPKNLTINISVWHENGVKEYKELHALRPDIIKAFVYDDGYDYAAAGLDIETYCTAYDRKGKMNHNITCDKCRKCIDRKCCVIGCYDH